MAFNVQTFKTRSLTALAFVAVMLGGLLGGYLPFILLFVIIHVGCWIEYQKLVGMIDVHYKEMSMLHKIGIIVVGLSLMLSRVDDYSCWHDDKLNYLGVEIFFALFLLIFFYDMLMIIQKKRKFKPGVYSMIGLAYISLSWGLMIDIRSHFQVNNTHAILPILIIVSIWINDTMAYIVGSFIGKTPLSKISPKKTWEGTVGGALIAITVVTIVASRWLNIDWHIVLGISAISAIAGTFGDLLESKLKRMAGVKDSGQIMPGHGGFLDRFDSLLVATPFVWLFLKIVMN